MDARFSLIVSFLHLIWHGSALRWATALDRSFGTLKITFKYFLLYFLFFYFTFFTLLNFLYFTYSFFTSLQFTFMFLSVFFSNLLVRNVFESFLTVFRYFLEKKISVKFSWYFPCLKRFENLELLECSERLSDKESLKFLFRKLSDKDSLDRSII